MTNENKTIIVLTEKKSRPMKVIFGSSNMVVLVEVLYNDIFILKIVKSMFFNYPLNL